MSLFALSTASLLLAYFAFLSTSVTPTQALTTVPTTMNFQGRLADSTGTIMPDGLYNMQFRLFTASSGGSAVWSETRQNNGTDYRVQVTNGLFSTKLGQVSPLTASLFASGNLYFEITMATPATATCSTNGCASWESPMTPRHQMSTSAYAYNAETLDGYDSAYFATATGGSGYIQNTTTPQTANFSITGTGTANIFQATTFDRATAGALTVGGTNATSIALADNTSVTGTLSVSSTLSASNLSGTNTGDISVSGQNYLSLVGQAVTANAINLASNVTGTLPIANGGTGASTSQSAINALSQLTTNGDLLFYNGTNSTRLARGTNGQCLTSSTTTVQWGSCGLSAESDTLASVTGRGATTATAVTFSGGLTASGTGTGLSVTNNATIGGTLGVTGTITGSNLSGTNTGDVSISGQNYLTIAGQSITANAINLGTNVTSTLGVANGGTGATTSQGAINALSQLTTNGDLLYHNGTNSTRLARGTNGQCLTSNATTLQWGSCGLSSEADTLATVTGRGATTSTAVALQGGATIRGLTVETATATQDQIILAAAATGAARFAGTITNADLTAARTYTLPDASGTLAVSASGNIALSAAGNITFTGTLTDAQVADTLTASNLVGSGSTTNAVDLATAEVAGTLPIARGGTGATTSQGAINALSQLTTNGDLLYHNGTNSTRLARGTNGQCLTSNATTLQWGSCGLSANLSNLTATSINQSLIANANNTLDLGSSSVGWRSGYFGTAAYAPLFDTASATTLTIGNTNATAINIGKTSSNIQISFTGTTSFKPSTGNDSTTAFQILNAADSGVFTLDTVNNQIETVNLIAGPSYGISAGRGGIFDGYRSVLQGNATDKPLMVNNETTGSAVTMIGFALNGTTQGTISANGTTVSYNAFTGSHVAKIAGGADIDESKLVRMNEQGMGRVNGDGEIIYSVSETAIANDPNVLGSYFGETTMGDEQAGGEEYSLIAAAGNGDVWLADNGSGDVRIGDQLLSSGDLAGYAQRDPGTYETSHVFAKAAQPVDWSTVTQTVNGVKVARVSVLFSFYNQNNAGRLLQGSNPTTLNGDIGIIGNLSVSGSATMANINVAGGATFGTLEVLGDTQLRGTLTVSGATHVADIYVGGHVISEGEAPAVSPGVALGVDGSEVTVHGTDGAGTLTIQSGASDIAAGVLSHVVFRDAYSDEYKVVITPSDANSAGLRLYVVKTEDGFDVMSSDTVTAQTEYTLDYIVQGVKQTQ